MSKWKRDVIVRFYTVGPQRPDSQYHLVASSRVGGFALELELELEPLSSLICVAQPNSSFERLPQLLAKPELGQYRTAQCSLVTTKRCLQSHLLAVSNSFTRTLYPASLAGHTSCVRLPPISLTHTTQWLQIPQKPAPPPLPPST